MYQNKGYIPGLDGLRAYSIMLVLLTHLGALLLLDNIVIKSLFSGTTGVNIFFTISGFLITLILLKEKENTGSINILNFYIRRFLRLLPVLILYLTVIFTLKKFDLLEYSNTSFIAVILYIYNYIPWTHYYPELGHFWSLGVEEQFYLFSPLILLIFSKRKWVIISVSLIFLCLISPIAYAKVPLNICGRDIDIQSMFPGSGSRFFFPAALPVIIGSLTAVAIKYGKINFDIKPQSYLVIGIAIYLISGFCISYIPYFPENILYSIATSLMIIFLLKHPTHSIVGFLEFKPIQYLGKISYGVYIWQGLFLRTGPGGELWVQQFPQNIFLTLAVSILSYHCWEKYFLRLKSKFN